jgi:hypothetical protein
LPRNLSDVLHYFMPELGPDPEPTSDTGAADRGPARPRASDQRRRTRTQDSSRPAIAAVPIGDHDLVRAAFTWNLAIEAARLGACTTLLSPRETEPGRLFPREGVGPGGAELRFSDASNLAELERAAAELTLAWQSRGDSAGLILVRIPPHWLQDARHSASLLGSLLLFTTAHQQDLAEAYQMARLVLLGNPDARVGVAVHGAREIAEAERAFSWMARSAGRDLGPGVDCYGTMLDDLDIYRSIVAQNATGLSSPQSPTARALRSVAKRVLERADDFAVA